MNGRPQEHMQVGIVHFMAYPAVMKGKGPVLETLEEICADDYFQVVEVTSVKRPKLRQQAIERVQAAGKAVALGLQPVLLAGKLNLNAADVNDRKKALDTVKAGIDEAIEWGAIGVAVLSGPDPEEEKRAEALRCLIGSLKECCEYSRANGGPPVLLEVFDRQAYAKNCLIGPTEQAVEIADAVACYSPRFGLMIDLSHLPLLDETPEQALTAAREHLRHVHIGNCVKSHEEHEAYGDNHPMFGIAEGENGVQELAAFLRVLADIEYVGLHKRNVVSFEVKPFGAQSPQDVIVNAKETLDAAWAMV